MRSPSLSLATVGATLTLAVAMACTGSDSADRAKNENNNSSPAPTVRRPSFPADTTFVDAHMHCGAIDESMAESPRCAASTSWNSATPQGAAGIINSIEHWTVSLDPELLASLKQSGDALGRVDELNEIYGASAATDSSLAWFASLECWHDTPFGPGWAQACKDDAKRWVEAGASGFKDHTGKLWQGGDDPSLADSGVFAGAWSRRAGRCANTTGQTANRECAKSEEVLYPLLTDEWRDVVRYIVAELKAPILSHATTWYGAEVECWDPLSGTLRYCPPMSRDHVLDFAGWAQTELDESARRRIIVGHSGFMIPGEKFLPRGSDTAEIAAERERQALELLEQLESLLATGLSVDSAATKDFVAFTYRQEGTLGACTLRELFARYPDQFIFGTDRLVDNGACLLETYTLWRDLLEGDIDSLGPERATCLGPISTYGLNIDEATIPQCAGTLPSDFGERFLRGNFLALYDNVP